MKKLMDGDMVYHVGTGFIGKVQDAGKGGAFARIRCPGNLLFTVRAGECEDEGYEPDELEVLLQEVWKAPMRQTALHIPGQYGWCERK